MSQKIDLQFSVPEGLRFSPKIYVSLTLEISDKILNLQLLLALIPTPSTNLIVQFVIYGLAKIRWSFHFKWCYINVILYSNNQLWWYILHCRDKKIGFPVIYNIIMLHVFIYVYLKNKGTKKAFFGCYAVALNFLQIRSCICSFYFNNV